MTNNTLILYFLILQRFATLSKLSQSSQELYYLGNLIQLQEDEASTETVVNHDSSQAEILYGLAWSMVYGNCLHKDEANLESQIVHKEKFCPNQFGAWYMAAAFTGSVLITSVLDLCNQLEQFKKILPFLGKNGHEEGQINKKYINKNLIVLYKKWQVLL